MKLENNAENGTMECRGPIGDFDGGISADDFKTLLAEHDGRDVTIHLDSEGGIVTDGLACYNAMMEYQGNVTIVVDTLAASIASVMAMAADTLIVKSTAQIMVHRAWCVAAGNALEYRDLADVLEKMDYSIAQTYAERTGESAETWMTRMNKDTYFSAEEAVEMGLADEVLYLSKERKPAKAEKKPLALAPVNSASIARAKNTARRIKLRLNK